MEEQIQKSKQEKAREDMSTEPSPWKVETFRNLLELVPAPIGIIRIEDGSYLEVNAAFCQMTGFSREEAASRDSSFSPDPVQQKRLIETFRESGGLIEGMEIRIRTKDGTSRDCLLYSRPLLFKGESCTLSVFTDLPSLNQAQAALRRSEERHRNILNTIEEGYWEVDLQGRFTFYNDAFWRLCGSPPRELLTGLDPRMQTSPEESKRLFDIFFQVFKTGIAAEVPDFEITHIDGALKIIEMSVSLLKDASGNPVGFYGISRDRTRQKVAERALRESEEKYRNILESIQEGYYEVDLRGNYTFFNEALANILGVSKNDLQGTNYKEFVDERGLQKVRETFDQVFGSKEPATDYGWEVIRKDGSRRYLEVSVALRKDEGGNPVGFKGVARDISERKWSEKALMESEAKYRTLFEAAQSAIFLIRNDQFIDCNSYTLKIFGCSREQIIGKRPFDFSPPKQPDGRDSREKALEKIKSALEGKPQIFEWKHFRWDGSLFDAEVSLNRTEIGGAFYIQAIVRDITEEKKAEAALKTMSLVDDLTGLYNRRGFLTLAAQEIKISNRLKQKNYLIFVDLDDMKIINDTFGHLEGDTALINTARVLKGSFRDSDILARIGGDEFVILAREGALKAGPRLLTERIRKHLKQHNETAKGPYHLSLSIGKVVYDPNHPIPIETLLAQADTLMYRDKQRKKRKKNKRNIDHRSIVL